MSATSSQVVQEKKIKDNANVAKCELVSPGEGYMGAHGAILALFLKSLKFSEQEAGGERDVPLRNTYVQGVAKVDGRLFIRQIPQ